MSSPRAKAARRGGRWLATAALLAVVPKCFACLAAYLGLAAALGLTGPELCGAPENPASHWVSWLTGTALALTLVWLIVTTRASRACPTAIASRDSLNRLRG